MNICKIIFAHILVEILHWSLKLIAIHVFSPLESCDICLAGVGAKLFFKTHIRWELKWAFLIAGRPFVCLFVYPSVCRLFSFSSSSLDHKAIFHQTWQTHSRVKGNQVHWDQRPGLFQRAGNTKKNVLTILKISSLNIIHYIFMKWKAASFFQRYKIVI